MREIWKDIKDYEGLYQVSNLGRVRSLKFGKERVLRPGKDNNGYLQVILCKDGKIKKFYVHRLVASAFIENPENKLEVNHKSEVKSDNRVENLEWIWHQDNLNYGTHNERVAKTQSKPVLQFTKTGEFIREWSSTMECGRNGFNQGNIAGCCLGKKKSYKGFLWKYK